MNRIILSLIKEVINYNTGLLSEEEFLDRVKEIYRIMKINMLPVK